MTDAFTFTGLGSHNTVSNDDNSSIKVNTINLSHPFILINIFKGKRKFQTTITGLSEDYIKQQNEDMTVKDLVKAFKIKKGCQGTIKKDEETNEMSITFGGKHREDVKEYLRSTLNVDEDQFKDQGV